MSNYRKILSIVIMLLFCHAVASVAETNNKITVITEFIKAHPVEGFPDTLNKVSVNIYKKNNHDKKSPILILISGWTCGAGWLHYLSHYLAIEKDIEVWTINRRHKMFEDRVLYNQLTKSLVKGKLTFRSFINKINHLNKFSVGSLKLLSKFGLRENIRDIHKVIIEASKNKRKLYLGGWSDGVEYAMAYSQTLFKVKNKKNKKENKFGHQYLNGLVFLDENPEWGKYSKWQMKNFARRVKSDIKAGKIVESRFPNILFFESASLWANSENPISNYFIGRPFRNYRLTGNALIGWLYDGGGKRSRWAWLFKCGRFKNEGKRLIDWESTELTPVKRIVDMHNAPGGVWEWFYPKRVALDYWEIGASNYNSKEMDIYPDKNNKLPVFAAFSSFNVFWGKIPAGIKYFINKTGISDSKVKVIKAFKFKHGDILLSPKAEKVIFDPLANWLLKH